MCMYKPIAYRKSVQIQRQQYNYFRIIAFPVVKNNEQKI